MSKQQEDGSWISKCPICTWKKEFKTKTEADNELNNHINIEHRKGKINVEDQKTLVPPKKMPPQIPKPVKENY